MWARAKPTHEQGPWHRACPESSRWLCRVGTQGVRRKMLRGETRGAGQGQRGGIEGFIPVLNGDALKVSGVEYHTVKYQEAPSGRGGEAELDLQPPAILWLGAQ